MKKIGDLRGEKVGTKVVDTKIVKIPDTIVIKGAFYGCKKLFKSNTGYKKSMKLK